LYYFLQKKATFDYDGGCNRFGVLLIIGVICTIIATCIFFTFSGDALLMILNPQYSAIHQIMKDASSLVRR
jgi:hypothetical protein